MGTISVSLPSDGTTADVADYNTPINTIVNEINGNLDNANIKANAAIAGSKLADGGITTIKLEDEAVTPPKLGLGTATAAVATSQGTTSTSFTDLATTGPAVTVTIGDGGIALVILSDSQENSTAGQWAVMGFAASGANTISANDNAAIINANSATVTSLQGSSYCILLTGLTPGSTTFTAKYRATGGTANFSNRRIAVIPLG